MRTTQLLMEAVSTSETSVNLYETTRRDIPEDSHLHTRRRENLKSHKEHVWKTYTAPEYAFRLSVVEDTEF
jgi:hypothetical protein